MTDEIWDQLAAIGKSAPGAWDELPPLPKKKRAVFHHPMGFDLYDGLAMDMHAMAYAEVCVAAAVARERERIANKWIADHGFDKHGVAAAIRKGE